MVIKNIWKNFKYLVVLQTMGVMAIFYAGTVERYGSHVQGEVSLVMEEVLQEDVLQGDALQEEPKRVALTFDDGPHPYYTEELLQGLLERGVKATFFVTGEHAMLHPDIIEKIYSEGHLIGNHTYSHMQLRKNNREKFKEELQKTNEIIASITGEEVLYVRPPYGSWDKQLEKELNMFPVLWNVDPLDWCSDDVESIIRRVMENANENDIILMHDYYATTVEAALQIVDGLLAEGFEFVTVDAILFD